MRANALARQAMLSNNKHALLSETSKVQLNIDFRLSPSLIDLEQLLTVISEESAEYDLFKVCSPSPKLQACDIIVLMRHLALLR